MSGGVFLLPRFQFAKLVQPGQRSFDEPAALAQAASMGGATFCQEGLYPLFLVALRCGSESYARSP